MFLFLMWARNNHLRYVFHYVPKLREHNEESVVSFGFWAVVFKTGKKLITFGSFWWISSLNHI